MELEKLKQEVEDALVESTGEKSELANQESGEIPKEVTYDVVDEPNYPATRALFMGNLMPPFDNGELQKMLEDNLKDSEMFIERAWLNKKRTHSIVLVSEIEGAQLLRQKLNGKIFPTVETSEANQIVRRPLFVDFIPVKVVQTWIDQEDEGPIDALWKLEYEIIRDRVIAQHRMINYSSIEPKSSKFYMDKRRRDEDRYRSYRDYSYNRYRGNHNGYYARGRGRYSKSTAERELSSSYVPGQTDDKNEPRHRRYDQSRGYHRDGYRNNYYDRGGSRYQPRRDNSFRNEAYENPRRTKTDDRERSRSPVRPSEMDWDLDN